MKLKVKTKQVIEVSDWDNLVIQTYNKPYSFQQQEGCKSRGVFHFTVPGEDNNHEMNDVIPEIVNHDTMGVKFDVWKSRDPKAPLESEEKGSRNDQWTIDLWWGRNFYPDFQTVANDLHAKGLLDAGDYTIDIDW